MRNRFLVIIAACAAVMYLVAPASAQRSGVGVFRNGPPNVPQYSRPAPLPEPPAVATGDYCAWAPQAFSCGSEVVMTACMTPEEWENCPDRQWYASGYDQRDTAPRGARPNNAIRFYERCGAVSRVMNSPRLAYWYAPRMLQSGEWHPGRWIVFAFSPPRQRN